MRATFGAAFALIAMLFVSGCADPPPTVTDGGIGSVRPLYAGTVYLMRGGLNIFSTGMDELAVKLRARGVDARSSGHAKWRELAEEARRNYAAHRTPIVIAGHSWGALGAMLMAQELARTGTPVALILLYDTTDSVKVPANVRRVVNFTSSTGIGINISVTGEPGFTGPIEPIPVREFNHLNMDNAPAVHERSIVEILKALKPLRR